MKKSSVRLIIIGLASLVLSVFLGIVTIIALMANTAAATDKQKAQEGFDQVRTAIESAVVDIGDMLDD